MFMCCDDTSHHATIEPLTGLSPGSITLLFSHFPRNRSESIFEYLISKMQPSPIISSSSALFISLSFAVIYVGSLYLSKNARLSFVSTPYRVEPGREDEERKKMKDERWRDDPDVIKARLVAASVATVVCCLGVFAVLFNHVGGTVKVRAYFPATQR